MAGTETTSASGTSDPLMLELVSSASASRAGSASAPASGSASVTGLLLDISESIKQEARESPPPLVEVNQAIISLVVNKHKIRSSGI